MLGKDEYRLLEGHAPSWPDATRLRNSTAWQAERVPSKVN